MVMRIEYPENNGAVIVHPVTRFADIHYLRAQIAGYQHQAIFPIKLLFNALAFMTTLPAERLGISPLGTGVTVC